MEKDATFPVFELSGTPTEIGIAHGRLAKRQISISIQNYKKMFESFSGISWETAQNYARTFIPAIEAYDKDIMDEIRGIAIGSGYELEDILALNVRSEIVLQGGMINGCTALGLAPEVMEDGNTWVAQNWDWKIQQREAYALFKIRQNNKPDLCLFTEAGIVGKLGLNSAGLGVCLNALGSDTFVKGAAVPLHIVLREILNSATLADAIENVGRVHVGCCANFLMGSAEGQVITIEAGPGDFDVLYGEEGWIAHTNHFVSPRWSQVHDTGKMAFPDTFLRYGRIRSLIQRQLAKGPIDSHQMRNFLRDHVGYPDAICRHEDSGDPEYRRMGTVFSIAMNLTQRELYITPGNPCETEYACYKM